MSRPTRRIGGTIWYAGCVRAIIYESITYLPNFWSTDSKRCARRPMPYYNLVQLPAVLLPHPVARNNGSSTTAGPRTSSFAHRFHRFLKFHPFSTRIISSVRLRRIQFPRNVVADKIRLFFIRQNTRNSSKNG